MGSLPQKLDPIHLWWLLSVIVLYNISGFVAGAAGLTLGEKHLDLLIIGDSMCKKLIHFFCIAIACCAVGIAQADDWKDESGKGKQKEYKEYQKDIDKERKKDWKERNKERKERGKEWKAERDYGGQSYFQRQGYSRLNIPQGHYPPPGECRIWFPDRPPGHQPPPTKNCSQVPPGAWVIQHPEDDQDHVHVTAYEIENPGNIIAVGEFEIGTGLFVRVILDY